MAVIEQLIINLGPAREWLHNTWHTVMGFFAVCWGLYTMAPFMLRFILFLTLLSACAGIGYSHIKPILELRHNWLKHPGHELMYGFFMGTGKHMAKIGYKRSHKYLRDNTFKFTISGITYNLGNYKNESLIITFLLSIPYLPMLLLTIIEMTLRFAIGTVYLAAVNMLHNILLFITKYIMYLGIPIASLVDRYLRKKQYCTKCYNEFNLPVFLCPICDKAHTQLTPGTCGILYAKCACNKKFLPATVFTGRSRLKSRCPSCGERLMAANSKQVFVQLIGGNNTGKTAYIAAFSYYYIHNPLPDLFIYGKPSSSFKQLAKTYQSNEAMAQSGLDDYNFLHCHKKPKNPPKETLVVYDIDGGQVITAYDKSPRHFSFCHGFMLFVDPFSVESVRLEASKNEADNTGIINYSPQTFDDVVNQFILDFNSIKGLSAGDQSNIPVAVIVSKSDIWPINQGMNDARAYLYNIGLINAIRSIETKFTNVNYFMVSAYGSVNIISPMAWLISQVGGGMVKNFDGLWGG